MTQETAENSAVNPPVNPALKPPVKPAVSQWVVAIGVDQYPYFPPLAAGADAEQFVRFWTEQVQVPPEQCLLLSCGQGDAAVTPTQWVMQQWLGYLNQWAIASQDCFWLWFSGYGVTHQGQDYWLPLEANPLQVAETGLSVAWIYEQLAALPTRNVVVLLDQQHYSNGFPVAGEPTPHPSPTARLATQHGITTLQSPCRDALPSDLGSFVTAVLEALQQAQGQKLAQFEQGVTKRLPGVEVLGPPLDQMSIEIPRSALPPVVPPVRTGPVIAPDLEPLGRSQTSDEAPLQDMTRPAGAIAARRLRQLPKAPPSQPRSLGDLQVGDLQVGDLQLGDLQLGDLQLGDLQLGDLQSGDLQLNDSQSGDLQREAAATEDLALEFWDLAGDPTGPDVPFQADPKLQEEKLQAETWESVVGGLSGYWTLDDLHLGEDEDLEDLGTSSDDAPESASEPVTSLVPPPLNQPLALKLSGLDTKRENPTPEFDFPSRHIEIPQLQSSQSDLPAQHSETPAVTEPQSTPSTGSSSGPSAGQPAAPSAGRTGHSSSDRTTPGTAVSTITRTRSNTLATPEQLGQARDWRPLAILGGLACAALAASISLNHLNQTQAALPKKTEPQVGKQPAKVSAIQAATQAPKTAPPPQVMSAGQDQPDPTAKPRPSMLAKARHKTAQAQQATPLRQAILEAQKIPSTHPEYKDAQAAIAIWSQEIFEIAKYRAQQKQFDAAAMAASLIPPNQAIAAEVKATAKLWCKQIKPSKPGNPVQIQQAKAVCSQF
jgi:hypothetical protein